MHFHVPKPLHGWREFAGEVGIIVVGVLIALGCEQVVSSVHDRASASETRQNVRGEIEDNLAVVLQRQRTEGCMSRRMNEITSFLDAASARKRPSPPSWIGAPYVPLVGDTRFKSAQSAGKFFILPETEQHELARFYVDGDDFNTANTREWYDWAQLRSLTSPSMQLNDTELTRLRQALQDARATDWLIRLDAAEFVRLAHDAGMVPNKDGMTNQVASVCLPVNMPYEEAAAKAGTSSVPFSE